MRVPVLRLGGRNRRAGTTTAVLVLLLGAGVAASSGVQETVVTPVASSVNAEPGASVTLVFRLSNRTETEQTVLPVVHLPEGWQLLVPTDPVTLAPEEERALLLLPVVVPRGAPAGEYPVRLDLRGVVGGIRIEGGVTVHVRALQGLEASLVSAPSYSLDEGYRLTFSVRNTGNASQSARFRIHENLGIQTVVMPAEAHLQPGESIFVDVEVQARGSLTKAATHRVQLLVEGDDSPTLLAQATAAVDLIPRTLGGEGAHHTFPLRVTLDHEATSAGGETGWQVSGSGAPVASDPGRLSFEVGSDGGWAMYTRSNLYLSLGEQRFLLSPLTEYGERRSTGAAVRATAGALDLAAYARQDVAGRDGGGAQVALDIGGSSALSLQYLDRPELSGDLWSLEVRLAATERWDFVGEYALQRAPTPAPAPEAFRLTSRYTGGPLVTQATWEQVEAGYRDADRASTQLKLFSALPLSDAVRLGIRLDQLTESGGLVSGGWARTLRNASLSLSGSWEGTGWWVQYARSEDVALDQRDQAEESLRVVLNQPADGGGALFQATGLKHVADRAGGTEGLTVSYRLSYYVARPKGSFSPYLQAEVPLQGEIPERFGFGVRAYRELHDRLTLGTRLDVHDVEAGRYRFQGDVRYVLPNAHTLAVEGEISGSRDQASKWTVDARYVLPFDLRLGRRADAGDVAGWVVDARGVALPGVVVELNGYRTTTDSEGRFRFPAVSPGEYYVTFRQDQLGTERITVPQTPWRVEVVAGATVEQEFRVVEGALVEGRLRLQTPSEDTLETGTVYGEGPKETAARWVAGWLVELANREVTYRRVTDEEGRFRFDGLPPGEWRLRVHRNGLADLPELYQIRPSEQVIHLAAGAEEQVDMDVIPVPRRVQLFTGGVLQPIVPERSDSDAPMDRSQQAGSGAGDLPATETGASAPVERQPRPTAQLPEGLGGGASPDVVGPGLRRVIPAGHLMPLYIQVWPQDTLSALARDFGVTLDALRQANPHIADPRRIQPGQWIRIPGLVEERYVMRRGDTLYSLGRSRGIPLAGLQRVNPEIIDPRRIPTGLEIVLPRWEGDPYVVRAGDTLWSIARTHGVLVETLLQMNPQIGDPRLILEGALIWVPRSR